MEASDAKSPDDLFLSPTRLQQLRTSNDPVLPTSEPRQRPVISASPREVGYSTTSGGLAFHALERGGEKRTFGAQIVPIVQPNAREPVEGAGDPPTEAPETTIAPSTPLRCATGSWGGAPPPPPPPGGGAHPPPAPPTPPRPRPRF